MELLYRKIDLNRRPTKDELDAIQDSSEEVGFKGRVGAIECMKLHSKYCLLSLKVKYKSSTQKHLAKIQVETWADH